MEEFYRLVNSQTRTILALARKRFFQLSEAEREAIDQSALEFREVSGRSQPITRE